MSQEQEVSPKLRLFLQYFPNNEWVTVEVSGVGFLCGLRAINKSWEWQFGHKHKQIPAVELIQDVIASEAFQIDLAKRRQEIEIAWDEVEPLGEQSLRWSLGTAHAIFGPAHLRNKDGAWARLPRSGSVHCLLSIRGRQSDSDPVDIPQCHRPLRCYCA